MVQPRSPSVASPTPAVRTPLRVAVVGCGAVAQAIHLPLLAKRRDARVVALADPIAQQRTAAKRHALHAEETDDYRSLLDRDDVDAVIVATATQHHAACAMAVLSAGKHLYLEKPLASTLEDGRRFLEHHPTTGVTAMVGFNYRFNPLVLELKRHIERGAIGAPVQVHTTFSTAATPLPDWKRTRHAGGGVLLDLGSHHFDLVQFLFASDVRRVSAMIGSRHGEQDDASVLLQLENGLVVQSHFSLGTVEEDCIEVHGDAGLLRLDRYAALSVELRGARQKRTRLHQLGRAVGQLSRVGYALDKIRSPWNEPSFAAAIEHFVNAARTGAAARPDLRDGYRSLEVVDAAERAAATGTTVTLDSSST